MKQIKGEFNEKLELPHQITILTINTDSLILFSFRKSRTAKISLRHL
jgi:hypothetical protein